MPGTPADPTTQQQQIADAYERRETVEQYARDKSLMACEEHAFALWVPEGGRILDLGVGGGRTTPWLLERAGDPARYVGLDFSQGMIDECVRAFPGLRFVQGDAADLSAFDDEAFDTVVFSFNGIDCLHPDAKRHDCLREIHRVLAPGGRLVLSTHNAQRVLVLPRQWRGEPWKRKAKRVALSARDTLRRLPAVLREGRLTRPDLYYLDTTHGESWYHAARPERFTDEVESFGFQRVGPVVPVEHPRRYVRYGSSWYYLAFRKR